MSLNETMHAVLVDRYENCPDPYEIVVVRTLEYEPGERWRVWYMFTREGHHPEGRKTFVNQEDIERLNK